MLIVLSNAGPLIALAKLNRLDLLETLYLQVQIPRAVYTEVVTQGLRYGASDALLIKAFWQDRGWSIIRPRSFLTAVKRNCWYWHSLFKAR
jgi:hypothetical protein